MKKTVLFTCACLLVIATAWAAGRVAIVRTRENHIREKARFYAPIKATVKFEDTLDVLDEQGAWLHVRHGDTEGWIHEAAVLRKRQMTYTPVLLGAETEPEAENDEVTLAGKGFNADVEKKVGETNPEFNFARVDEIEMYAVDPETLEQFIRNGQLEMPK